MTGDGTNMVIDDVGMTKLQSVGRGQGCLLLHQFLDPQPRDGVIGEVEALGHYLPLNVLGLAPDLHEARHSLQEPRDETNWD